MGEFVIDYGTETRHAWRKWLIRATVVGALAFTLLTLTWVGNSTLREWQCRREQAKLLAANAPEVMFNSPTISFAAGGRIYLSDGRVAKLAEVSLTREEPKAGAIINELITLYRVEKLGYTITGSDPDGIPVVQVWGLSPRAFVGMCGNSTYYERRQGAMRLWRNVGAIMVDRYHVKPTPEGERSTISVVGY